MRSEQLTRRGLTVPFFDLGPSHANLRAAILRDLEQLIEENAYTNGRQVTEFERAFAAYCGTATCVGTSNGLDALRLAFLAAGIEAGDEVVVPAGTFVASLEAVTQAGGRPVLADVSDDDYCVAVDAAEAAIGPRTRFLLPVHLYGQMADMRAIGELADRHGLEVIEDACQAHGATRDGLRAGATGIAGAFSFYPAKNLGAFGDAGALITDDDDLAVRVRALREHGQREKYSHAVEGYTARLDTIQAIVLLHKLPLLEEWNAQRRAAAAYYGTALQGTGDLRLPSVATGSEPAWHVYVVRTADPTALAEHLGSCGIGAGRHYPEAVHLSAAYAWLGHRPGAFPVAESLAAQCLSLPLFPGITEEQLASVAEAVAGYFDG